MAYPNFEREKPEIEALPFVEKISGRKVYFTPITFVEYTVRGMMVFFPEDADGVGFIAQAAGDYMTAQHPHITFVGSWFCTDQSISVSFERGYAETVTMAYCLASTYTPWRAYRVPPMSIVCDVCKKVITKQNSATFYHLDSGKTIACCPKCYIHQDTPN